MFASRKSLIVVAAFVLMAIGLPWGRNVPAAFAQTISVTEAVPPTGEQGALNLNVTIKGKGFKNGAKATFYKTKTTDPAGVNVKSTQFVSSTQLIANIDIADAAALSMFDIEVRNADGRTGKGTELFSVLEKTISPCTLPDPVPLPSNYIAGLPGHPGYLDSTFGDGTGRVIGLRSMLTKTMGLDHSGRIVAAGYAYDPCQSGGAAAWAVARYLQDGQIDTGFGTGGLVSKAFGSKNAQLDAIAIDANARIVVAGYAPGKAGEVFAVARYDATGMLDPSFAGTGFVLLPDERYTGRVFALATQSDGKIVLAGISGGVLRVVRLNQNGTLDASFNGSGQFLDTVGGRGYAVTMRWVGSEEQIVVAGSRKATDGAGRATIWRFTHAGALLGTASVMTEPSSEFQGLALDSSNRLFAAGHVIHSLTLTSELLLACYDASGNLVTDFGNGGTVSPIPRLPVERAGNIAVQPDGSIVVGGKSNECAGACCPTCGSGMDYATLWRFTKDGILDSTFGSDGSVSDGITGERPWWISGSATTVRPFLSYGHRIALQSDGRVVWAAGAVFKDGPYYTVLARFWLW